MFNQAITDGWLGNGTKMYPFIIDPLVMKSSLTTIEINNVNSYFILRNFFLTGIGVTIKIGIALNNVSNGFIINNTISNFNSTGILINSSKRVELLNNSIYNNIEGISIHNSFNISVTNNTIKDNEKIGINILSSKQNFISNNTLANLNDEIIFAYSGENTINDNNIQNGGLIFFGFDQNHFLQTEVVNNRNFGKEIVFWQNKLEGTIPTGVSQVILVNSTNISVMDKKLNNPAAGVHLFYSKNIVIHDNSISGNHNRETILIFASENVSVKNNLHFRSKKGISIHYSTRCEISENNLISLADEGIILESSIDNLIEGNTIDNTYNGITLINSTQTQIVRNEILDSHNYGILFTFSHENSIIKNLAKNNFQGIFLDSSDENLIMQNNVITNENIGIGLNMAFKNEIYNNSILKNSDFGIFVLDSNSSTIQQNNIKENEFGVHLGNSHNSKIIGNSISNSTEHGIAMFSSNKNEILNNSMNHNGKVGINLQISHFNLFESNIIYNNSLNYGIKLSNSNSNFFKNNILAQNNLIFKKSQVYDKGTNNLFISNYYDDLTSPDRDKDGFIDIAYLFDGQANNSDTKPLATQNEIILDNNNNNNKATPGWSYTIFIMTVIGLFIVNRLLQRLRRNLN
jgi:parallel beta-helix repeat protein